MPSQGVGKRRAGVASALTTKSKHLEVRPHAEGSPQLAAAPRAVFAGIGEEQDPIEVVARLGARLILQQALEDEVTEFVGRGRYERADGGEEAIYRNGFAKPSTVAATSGPTQVVRSRVRNAKAVGFESQVVGKGVARTHALEALVICSFLRGLSVRDVEAALEEAFG